MTSACGSGGGTPLEGGSGGAPSGAGGASGPAAGGATGAGGGLGAGGSAPLGSGGALSATGGQAASGGGSAGGSENGSGSGGGAPLEALTVSDLKIEVNPKMPLGAFVTWTTDQAANSEVQFGEGALSLRTVVEESVTEHRVYVLGMHAETQYDIKAVSTNATATGSATGDVTTGALPSFLPDKMSVVTAAGAEVAPGYTLTNFWDSGQSPTIALIVDAEGIPVWFVQNGTARDQFGATSTEITPDGTILMGPHSEPAREVDLEGNVLWTGPTGGSGSLSHHTHKSKAGTYYVVRESGSTARVEELDRDNKVIWSWDLYTDGGVNNGGANDWCHVNAVSTDAAEKFVYFNCRYQGLYKVEKSSKNLIWHMGAAMDDSMSGDVTYKPDNSVRFNDAHDPEVHEDGTALFYDNQGWSNRTVGEANGSFKSQVVEYQLDETKKEATLSWSFPGSFETDAWYKTNWSTPIWGDADRLENGNVLVTAGLTGTTAGGMTPPGTKTRIFEVTREGKVVWAVEWPEAKGSYRAERMSLPVEALP